jgi:hypothetical protein
MTKCKKCGAGIEFVQTKKGRLMPVDVNESIVKNKITGEDESVKLSHFATCPYAGDFRKTKKGDEPMRG